MKIIECICEICGLKFNRAKKEYNRNLKKGRRIFCSRKCSGKSNLEKFKQIPRTTEHLKKYWKERKFGRDEFSVFREHLRCAKRRSKEIDIDLYYLKEIWENQQGRCPFTNWKLSLDRKNLPNQASLDRIDSNRGYVKGNVRFIALIANYCKNSFSDEDVKEFCKAVSLN